METFLRVRRAAKGRTDAEAARALGVPAGGDRPGPARASSKRSSPSMTARVKESSAEVYAKADRRAAASAAGDPRPERRARNLDEQIADARAGAGGHPPRRDAAARACRATCGEWPSGAPSSNRSLRDAALRLARGGARARLLPRRATRSWGPRNGSSRRRRAAAPRSSPSPIRSARNALRSREPDEAPRRPARSSRQALGRGLRLEDPPGRYLPEWKKTRYDGITVEHLLTHTSGLPAWFPLYARGEGAAAYRRTLARDRAGAPARSGRRLQRPRVPRRSARSSSVLFSAPLDRSLRGARRRARGIGRAGYRPEPAAIPCAATEKGDRFERRMTATSGSPTPGFARAWSAGDVHDGNALRRGGRRGQRRPLRRPPRTSGGSRAAGSTRRPGADFTRDPHPRARRGARPRLAGAPGRRLRDSRSSPKRPSGTRVSPARRSGSTRSATRSSCC